MVFRLILSRCCESILAVSESDIGRGVDLQALGVTSMIAVIDKVANSRCHGPDRKEGGLA